MITPEIATAIATQHYGLACTAIRYPVNTITTFVLTHTMAVSISLKSQTRQQSSYSAITKHSLKPSHGCFVAIHCTGSANHGDWKQHLTISTLSGSFVILRVRTFAG